MTDDEIVLQRIVAIESGAWPDWCGETVGDVLAERDALQKECQRLATRLDDVLALHGREGTFRGLHDENMFCVGCGSAWPCPTVHAATGEGYHAAP